MAQAGFPWHSQSQDTAQISEKDSSRTSLETTITNSTLVDTTNQKSVTFPVTENKPLKANGSVRRSRADSVRTSAIARHNIRFQTEPPRNREPIKRIPVRTIPPWIQDADEDDLLEAGFTLPDNPNTALVAQHNHSPAHTRRNGGFPLSSGGTRNEPTSRWVSFARASAYPRENFNNEVVEPQWLNENFTDYSKPWLADHNEDDIEDGSDKYRAFKRKRRVWYKRAHFAIMRNPFVPLVLRLIVIIFAAVAMALGASIHHANNVIERCIRQPQGSRTPECASRAGQGYVSYDRDPSALMAIIVDAVAIVYSVYITYDEYFSKPLGLRPPGAKVRLVLLDLFFIVFQSATLSMAFNSLTIDQGSCRVGTVESESLKFDNVCNRASALSAVLLISLFAWLLTFSVSILRLVERINTR